MATNGIFCLEGDWSSTLTDKSSVRPVLDLLTARRRIKAIHRSVGSTAEIKSRITEWGKAAYDDYLVVALAMHGDDGRIHWSTRSKDYVTLEDLASYFPNNASTSSVYLGSCLTLADDDATTQFVKRAGIRAAVGYEYEVDWIEAAAFEVILFDHMANHADHPKALFDRLTAIYPDLTRRLGLVVGSTRSVYRASSL